MYSGLFLQHDVALPRAINERVHRVLVRHFVDQRCRVHQLARHRRVRFHEHRAQVFIINRPFDVRRRQREVALGEIFPMRREPMVQEFWIDPAKRRRMREQV